MPDGPAFGRGVGLEAAPDDGEVGRGVGVRRRKGVNASAPLFGGVVREGAADNVNGAGPCVQRAAIAGWARGAVAVEYAVGQGERRADGGDTTTAVGVAV